ncbi:hypothetical protein GGR33_004419 [Methylobacterium brachythecii]|nr:hypothetical protein [Methylobacterium brachythecii]
MSPALARALRELFRDQHEIAILSEKFARTATDIEWISGLNREGRWIVISEDRRITRNHAEYTAFRNSKLVGIFLAKAVHKAPVVKKMERILAVWPALEVLSETVEGGAMFELPINGTRVRQLKS